MAPNIPASMIAWRKHRGNMEAVREELPVPQPGPHEVLVKILATGVCRSDHSLLTYETQPQWFQQQFTLGHEGCGEVVQIGPDLDRTDIEIGGIFALFATPGCGGSDCTECSRDLAQICERGHHSGIGQDGFHAQYAVINERGLVAVPEGVSPAVAAVACDAVTTAYHAITRRGEVKSTEMCFLFGLGGLGFNALQIVHNIGARVIVSDVKQERLDDAKALGIPEEDIVPVGQSVVDFVRERNLHIDTVLDFVGTHQTFDNAQDIVRRGGKLLCIGSLNTENTIRMKIGTRKRLSYIFSYGGQPKDLAKVLDLIKSGQIQPQISTKTLEDFPHVLRDLEAGRVDGRIALIPPH